MLVEKEEGLFTLHGATRALCVLAAISWVLSRLAVLALIVSAIPLMTGQPLVLDPLLALIAAAVLFASTLVIASILRLWRRCGCYGKWLFEDGGIPLLLQAWVPVGVNRDYRAKPFLGSYGNGAILNMALKGRLRCQWCGHEDGTEPDYVVTSRLP